MSDKTKIPIGEGRYKHMFKIEDSGSDKAKTPLLDLRVLVFERQLSALHPKEDEYCIEMGTLDQLRKTLQSDMSHDDWVFLMAELILGETDRAIFLREEEGVLWFKKL